MLLSFRGNRDVSVSHSHPMRLEFCPGLDGIFPRQIGSKFSFMVQFERLHHLAAVRMDFLSIIELVELLLFWDRRSRLLNMSIDYSCHAGRRYLNASDATSCGVRSSLLGLCQYGGDMPSMAKVTPVLSSLPSLSYPPPGFLRWPGTQTSFSIA
jgi:hypothetical protein